MRASVSSPLRRSLFAPAESAGDPRDRKLTVDELAGRALTGLAIKGAFTRLVKLSGVNSRAVASVGIWT